MPILSTTAISETTNRHGRSTIIAEHNNNTINRAKQESKQDKTEKGMQRLDRWIEQD